MCVHAPPLRPQRQPPAPPRSGDWGLAGTRRWGAARRPPTRLGSGTPSSVAAAAAACSGASSATASAGRGRAQRRVRAPAQQNQAAPRLSTPSPTLRMSCLSRSYASSTAPVATGCSGTPSSARMRLIFSSTFAARTPPSPDAGGGLKRRERRYTAPRTEPGAPASTACSVPLPLAPGAALTRYCS